MTVATLALSAVGILAFWVFGGMVLRVLGLILSVLALFSLVVSGRGSGVLLLPVGVLLWLAGHWHFALRHHAYRSPLAERIFVHVLPRRLDPARDWPMPVRQVERPDR